MDQTICLDSDMLIYYLRKKDKGVKVRELIEQGKKVCTTSINAFELQTGTEGTEVIEKFLLTIPIIDFDKSAAHVAATVYKKLKSNGNLIESRDLFIGAICIANNFILLTNNHRHFERVPNLKLFND